ncbi:MAG: hypothetical protein K2Y05_00320 [Hyphomicrobiaceae bacterium]|nr:hypothetical protein [Hyphomicrobiaceae bacterium]
MRLMWHSAAIAGVGSVLLTIAAAAQGVRKPVPLPGADPGGVTVAIIGPGVDYTRAGLSDRLARDGEGEIIGFDLVDRDRRPFCRVECEAQTDAAMALLQAAPGTRLALFKVDGANLAAPALQMAVTAKAAVVLLELPDDAQAAALLRAASERFRDTLIVFSPRQSAVRNAAQPSSEGPAKPGETGLASASAAPTVGNATASAAGGTADKSSLPNTSSPPPATAKDPAQPSDATQPAPPTSPNTASPATVTTAVPPPSRSDTVIAARDGNVSPAETSLAAAVRLAAEAANIVTASPATRGAALKARVEATP